MFQSLSAEQWQIVQLILVVWLLVLVWLILRVPPPPANRFDKFMEWRLWQNKPHGTVEEWFSAPSDQKGAPSPPATRLKQCVQWTAFVAFALCMFFVLAD